MAVCVATVIVACITMLALRWENKQADEDKRVIEGPPAFRYTI